MPPYCLHYMAYDGSKYYSKYFEADSAGEIAHWLGQIRPPWLEECLSSLRASHYSSPPETELLANALRQIEVVMVRVNEAPQMQ
jgi:hypothetical protein